MFVAKARTVSPERTLICGTRYGNVMCSRGSVIPLFIDQIRSGQPLTVTSPDMTRFIMSLEEAVELVLFAFEHAHSGDILVKKAPPVPPCAGPGGERAVSCAGPSRAHHWYPPWRKDV